MACLNNRGRIASFVEGLAPFLSLRNWGFLTYVKMNTINNYWNLWVCSARWCINRCLRQQLDLIQFDSSIRFAEGLTPRNVRLRISLRWPIHIINPVDKTKLSTGHYIGALYFWSTIDELLLITTISWPNVSIIDCQTWLCYPFSRDLIQERVGNFKI